MTVTMEDSQSVVMKKCMPALESLQLRKKKGERGWGGRRRQNSSVTSKAQSKNCMTARLWVLLTAAIPPSLRYCMPSTCRHYTRCRELEAE